MKRIKRQFAFLTSLFRDTHRKQREDLIRHANSDQINTISELVLNTLKGHVSLTPDVIARLKRYKKLLRDLSKRKHSVKHRRSLLLKQKGSGIWQSLLHVCRCLQQ